MPHISVKLWPGKSDAQKQRLADAISACTQEILGEADASISVAFEEVQAANWKEHVFDPEIKGKPDSLFKKPGYSY